MRITPMDIQRQDFRRAFRGFDASEVRAYLGLLAEDVAALQAERDALEQEAQNLRSLLDEHRQREAILKNTLLTAQRVSEEIRDNARKQAEMVVKEAEMQADRLLELAQSRAGDVERAILDLRAHRSALVTDIRALLDRLGDLIDLQEEAQRDDNLRFLRRGREGGTA
jgi:cell division initiation protein